MSTTDTPTPVEKLIEENLSATKELRLWGRIDDSVIQLDSLLTTLNTEKYRDITYLSLASNHKTFSDPHSISSLVSFITSNKTVQELYLANCNIGKEDGLRLVEAIRANNTLKKVDLWMNPVGSDIEAQVNALLNGESAGAFERHSVPATANQVSTSVEGSADIVEAIEKLQKSIEKKDDKDSANFDDVRNQLNLIRTAINENEDDD